GRGWFEAVFYELAPSCLVEWRVGEGDEVGADSELCRVMGPARALLSGERTAINLLQTLSGTATRARRFAEAVAGTGTVVLDTRKTIPGLRRLQKYAVKVGGCENHRFGLYDGILLKENHILASGSLTQAMRQARTFAEALPVEVEVESLAELEEALTVGADIILLDNFSLEEMRTAVELASGRALLEASGNIDLTNVRRVAETGVDRISVGAITKHLQTIDLSMRISLKERGEHKT
ncbi:MAG: carboxylating nicotinate-nucleotide diphosphorylase, partial [Methylothermaceae bacterium]|nr:carboxylating nicotinate-nucleotide diphosphorylase [Methylothermaceae bacterium]